MSRYADSHLYTKRSGPGDARPTALQIIADENLTGRLSDKVFVVTGISSGIGIETLRALHTTGAHVIGTVRDLIKGQKVVDDVLVGGLAGGGKITLVELDLESFDSVRKGAKEILEKSHEKINVVIANAGVMGVPFAKTGDGWERQFATNYLGHFLLFQLVKDALLNSATAQFPSRYVSLSSHGHCFGTVNFDDYNFEKTDFVTWRAYGQSKTACLWLSNAIERKFGARGLHSTSLHPGGVKTNLTAKLGPEIQELYKQPDIARYMKSPEQGAATQVYAAVSEEWENKGGSYLVDCAVAQSQKENKAAGVNEQINDGYTEWTYNEDGEERLWKESFAMVGLPEQP